MNSQNHPERPDIFQDLFDQVEPRLKPPDTDRQMIHDALHEEWRHLTRRRKFRNYAFSAGIAASLLVAGLFGLDMFNKVNPVMDLAPLASIERQTGSITINTADQQAPAVTNARSGNLYPGQRLTTGNASRIALRWHGGESVRLDENTRVRLTTSQEIELLTGRLYIDTRKAAPGPTATTDLVITTSAGTVRHLGTQYMTGIKGQQLVISVREGRVSFQSDSNQTVANPGQQLTVDRAGEINQATIEVYGTDWQWTQSIAPEFNLDGQTMTQFLNWVGRETGRTVYFASLSAQQLADATILRGNIDLEPGAALDVMLQTSDLEARPDGQLIIVNRRERP